MRCLTRWMDLGAANPSKTRLNACSAILANRAVLGLPGRALSPCLVAHRRQSGLGGGAWDRARLEVHRSECPARAASGLPPARDTSTRARNPKTSALPRLRGTHGWRLSCVANGQSRASRTMPIRMPQLSLPTSRITGRADSSVKTPLLGVKPMEHPVVDGREQQAGHANEDQSRE